MGTRSLVFHFLYAKPMNVSKSSYCNIVVLSALLNIDDNSSVDLFS